MTIRKSARPSPLQHLGIRRKGLIVGLTMMAVSPCFALDSASLAALPNVAQPVRGVVTTSALTSTDVQRAADAGITRIVDLRLDAETPDFDEGQAVRDAGMTYTNLPIRGPDDLTRENATQFDQLIAEAHETSTLIHCASGNRVGALAALRAAWIQNASIDESIAEGRRWGLGSLEPAVRERLSASAMAAAATKQAATPLEDICDAGSATAAKQAEGCEQ